MIHYLQGDATYPQGPGNKYIVHVCNDQGGWGAGFVLALSRRWSWPEDRYREWFRTGKGFELGATQMVQVESDIFVVNMLAQTGYGPARRGQHREAGDDSIPLRYEELQKCLLKVALGAHLDEASIHMPRIGCALAGGSWSRVEPIIQETLQDLEVFVYDYPGGTFNP